MSTYEGEYEETWEGVKLELKIKRQKIDIFPFYVVSYGSARQHVKELGNMARVEEKLRKAGKWCIEEHHRRMKAAKEREEMMKRVICQITPRPCIEAKEQELGMGLDLTEWRPEHRHVFDNHKT